MKILLTGCSGQVGWEVCQRANSFKDLLIIPTNSKMLDITDIIAIRHYQNQHNADIIINAAAYTAVDTAETNSNDAFQTNAAGTENLAIVAAEYNIPLLHISTDYVFDGSSSSPYTEVDSTNPMGVYGKSKLEGERLLAKANPKHIILRTSWVFGIEGNNFVKTMLRLGSDLPEISVVADQFGSPTFAGSIANALLQIASDYNQSDIQPWGLYNFSDNGVTTWHGFAQQIMAYGHELGLIENLPKVIPINTSEYPTPAPRPANSALNCSIFKQTFPHIELADWNTNLRQMIERLSQRKLK